MKKTAIAGAFVSLCLVGSAGTAAIAAGHHQPAASHQPAKAKKLTFHLMIDGHKAGVKTVEIGGKSLHPNKVPFTITRTGIR